MRRKRLSVFPAELLHRLGLLIAFIPIVAATEFNSNHPLLTAGLVFLFSLGYLVASVMAKRAGFLYGTMLFGAVAFFLMSYGLGAPVTSFPLLSVFLVLCLLIVGHRLTQLPNELKSFPLAVFRAMNITVIIFSIWALVQVGHLLDQEGLIRYVATFTFLGYAGIYLAHRIFGQKAIYTYIFAVFLMLGSLFFVRVVWTVDMCWFAALISTAVILLLGTALHQTREYLWSRHFYFSSIPVIVVSLLATVWYWPYLILDFALLSLLFLIAYERLRGAVGNVVSAAMAERVVAKCFFFGALGFAIPVLPILVVQPGNVHIALAGVVCAITFSLLGWQRRGPDDKDGSYILAATMFAAAGILGLGKQLPGVSGLILAISIPFTIMGCLGYLCVYFEKIGDLITRKRIAVALIFPVFFAWFFLILSDRIGLALAVALMMTAFVVYLGIFLKERLIYYALGPGIAGVIISVILMQKENFKAWVACTIATVVAGALYAWAGMCAKKITREATNLAWLILSIASVTFAWSGEVPELLYSVSAVATVAVLISWRSQYHQYDVFDYMVSGLAYLATVAVLVMAALGTVIGLNLVNVGACVFILSVAYWLVWATQRGTQGAAYWANGLFALGSLLLIYGVVSDVEVRLGSGAVVVLILLVTAALARHRFVSMSNTAVMTAHVTSILLATATLVQTWSVVTDHMYMVAVPLVLFYAFMPRLRTNQGLRQGGVLWFSFVVLFSIVAYTSTPFPQQIHLVGLLSLVWVVSGFLLDHTKAKSWARPFYVTAAIVACFCCLVRILGPVTETSWLVFLTGGVAFVCLYLLVRDDIYAYLISVALALMGYDWLRGTSSIFTADIFFWLTVAGVLFAGVFLLPHLLKRLTRSGTIPMFSFFTWFGAAIMFLVIAAFGAVAFSAYSIKITGHPKFCVSCHNMEEYYVSWQHSSHKDVACVDCHYEPGMAATVTGKMHGMVQLVQYVAGSYGTRPHGEISSASCQQIGCHEEIVEDRTLLMLYDKIKFRHDKHLIEHPNGKALNCVSCHGQTVQDQHISVSKTTCLTCHFYNRGDKEVAIGNCETCHILPEEEVTFVDEPFSHRDFLKDDRHVTCLHCHSQVTQGSGLVSRTQCKSCHLEEHGAVEDQEAFHLIHVSEGHFDCIHCHEEIKHGNLAMAEQLLTSANCSTCHGDKRHSIQEAIYAGTAIPDMEVMPDVMYEAGVACDGCHDEAQMIMLGNLTLTSRLSGAKQCVDCHGDEDYAEQLASWQEATKEMLAEIRPMLEVLETKLKSSQASGETLKDAKQLSKSARTKFEFVVQDGSYGAHNVGYVMEILDKVLEEIEQGQSLLD